MRARRSLQLARVVSAVALSSAGALASAAALPESFVYLRDIDPTILQDMRYAGSNNFTGAPVTGYEAAECVLVRPAAEALAAVQALALRAIADRLEHGEALPGEFVNVSFIAA